MKNMLKSMLMLGLILTASVQMMNAEVVLEGTTFVTTSATSVKPVETGYTWKDSKGVEYPIYLSANGRAYVMKVSGKTSKEYKYYLGEDISRQICAKIGIKYVEKGK